MRERRVQRLIRTLGSIKEGKECPSDGGLPTGGRDRKGFESDTKTITFVSNSKINANRVLVILEALGTDKVAA